MFGEELQFWVTFIDEVSFRCWFCASCVFLKTGAPKFKISVYV